MIQVGAYEAKTHLSSLLEKVYHGEEIMITRHHIPVAKIIPVPGREKSCRTSAINELKEFCKGRKLKDISITELIAEGVTEKGIFLLIFLMQSNLFRLKPMSCTIGK